MPNWGVLCNVIRNTQQSIEEEIYSSFKHFVSETSTSGFVYVGENLDSISTEHSALLSHITKVISCLGLD